MIRSVQLVVVEGTDRSGKQIELVEFTDGTIGIRSGEAQLLAYNWDAGEIDYAVGIFLGMLPPFGVDEDPPSRSFASGKPPRFRSESDEQRKG